METVMINTTGNYPTLGAEWEGINPAGQTGHQSRILRAVNATRPKLPTVPHMRQLYTPPGTTLSCYYLP